MNRLPSYLRVSPCGPTALRITTRHGHLVMDTAVAYELIDAVADAMDDHEQIWNS